MVKEIRWGAANSFGVLEPRELIGERWGRVTIILEAEITYSSLLFSVSSNCQVLWSNELRTADFKSLVQVSD